MRSSLVSVGLIDPAISTCGTHTSADNDQKASVNARNSRESVFLMFFI